MNHHGAAKLMHNLPRRSLDADSKPIMEKLIELQVKKPQAQKMAIRIWNRQNTEAISTLTQLLDAGWTAVEFCEHDEKNLNAWRHPAEVLLRAEQHLTEAGLGSELARRLVILHPIAVEFEPEPLSASIAAFRDVGMTDDHLRNIGLNQPRAFKVDPDSIRIWGTTRKPAAHPIKSLYPLISGRPNKAMRARLASPSRGDPPPPPPTPATKREDLPEYQDEHLRNWHMDVPTILHIIDPLEPKKEIERAKTYDWIWDGSTDAKRVLDELALWTGLRGHISASLNDSPVLSFFGRMLKEESMHAFLRLNPEAAKLRMHVVRRFILAKKDILEKPELLLHPWERFTELEIRYRINELDSLGLRRTSSNVLRALLEPERRAFQEAMQKFKKAADDLKKRFP
jgi:hypothetical protein